MNLRNHPLLPRHPLAILIACVALVGFTAAVAPARLASASPRNAVTRASSAASATVSCA